MSSEQSIERRNTKVRSSGFGDLSQYWRPFLERKMKLFLKKEYNEFFNIAKFWLIAAENEPSIDLDFVYSSPLISIVTEHLLNYMDLASETILASILEIIAVLTSFKSPETEFFSTPELLQVYTNLLSSKNPIIVKLAIIIFSQLLYKDPELLSFIYSINLKDTLMTNFLYFGNTDECKNPQNEDVSAVSTFLLCEIALLDEDATNTILETLFNFSVPQDTEISQKPVLSLFNSILFIVSESPDFLNSIIDNGFCQLSTQLLPMMTDDTINLTISIFSILLLIIKDENGLDIFISSDLISLISQGEFINQTQNQGIFSVLMEMFAILVSKCNPDINQQIIDNRIIEQSCICALESEYQNKMDAIEFICNVLQSSNRDMCKIVEENDGLHILFDIFDTFKEDMQILVIQSLIAVLDACPELKELFLTFDLDAFSDIIEKINDEEIVLQGDNLLSLIQS